MAMVEISGYPPVNDVVEAWVNVEWAFVYWDGSLWRYEFSGKPVAAVITHWHYSGQVSHVDRTD